VPIKIIRAKTVQRGSFWFSGLLAYLFSVFYNTQYEF